ncbi:gp436 family protein [Halomonas sp. E14]|uniref:gp436 family protein n=1 Tax=Halomonas sp. E14 TaxID=3397245 RepID=UPI00403E7C7F
MYASVADMVARFGETEIVELTDLEHTGEIDTAVAERALEDASAEIDGYLASRYRLPVTDTPRLLSTLCTDIARYRLQKGVSTEQARQRYEDAVARLRGIARGEINLPLESPPPASAEPVAVRGRRRVFDDDTMRGY